jgi:hypothetical protein
VRALSVKRAADLRADSEVDLELDQSDFEFASRHGRMPNDAGEGRTRNAFQIVANEPGADGAGIRPEIRLARMSQSPPNLRLYGKKSSACKLSNAAGVQPGVVV